ncbi:hypothetical protein HYS28_01325 [Candidatus Uhrbacteria bacterium]|nr:hypothetical protein [Candidatus Uhrbacteria bacterium]
MRPYRLAALLGLSHAAADAATGFAVGMLAVGGLREAATAILLYNIVAFGLQPLAGLLVDRRAAYRRGTVAGLLASALGLVVAFIHPVAGIVIIGVGSACFHVGAGVLACQATPGKALAPGIFTAPGVVGLGFGVLAAFRAWPIAPVVLAALAACAYAVHRSTQDTARPIPSAPSSRVALAALAVLVIAIIIRSATWTVVGGAAWSEWSVGVFFAISVAAGIGKLAGGYLGDYFGFGSTTLFSIFLAFVILSVESSAASTAVAVFALQSSTPILLAALVGKARRPATIAGLVLGLAVALGAVLAAVTIAGDAPGTMEFWHLGVPALFAFAFGFWLLGRVTRRQQGVSGPAGRP